MNAVDKVLRKKEVRLYNDSQHAYCTHTCTLATAAPKEVMLSLGQACKSLVGAFELVHCTLELLSEVPPSLFCVRHPGYSQALSILREAAITNHYSARVLC
jgi:hypothetical protein